MKFAFPPFFAVIFWKNPKCAIFFTFRAMRELTKNMRDEGVQMRHFGAYAPNLEALKLTFRTKIGRIFN